MQFKNPSCALESIHCTRTTRGWYRSLVLLSQYTVLGRLVDCILVIRQSDVDGMEAAGPSRLGHPKDDLIAAFDMWDRAAYLKRVAATPG